MHMHSNYTHTFIHRNDIETNPKTALNFHLFDIEEDLNVELSSPSKAESASNMSPLVRGTGFSNGRSEITCNSTQLVRENVDPTGEC